MIPALLTSVLFAGQASALEFGGANIEVVYSTFGASQSQEQINGSFEVSFGNALGVQIDLMNTSYNLFDGSGAFGGGAHVFYEVSPALTVGGFYISEDWGSTYASYGVEALYETPRIAYEFAVGAYQRVGDDANIFLNVDAAYHLNDKLDITAGIVVSYWSEFGNINDLFNNYSIGGRYAFDNGLYVGAEYNLLVSGSSSGESSFGLTLGYDFGGGATFERRGYAALWPAD